MVSKLWRHVKFKIREWNSSSCCDPPMQVNLKVSKVCHPLKSFTAFWSLNSRLATKWTRSSLSRVTKAAQLWRDSLHQLITFLHKYFILSPAPERISINLSWLKGTFNLVASTLCSTFSVSWIITVYLTSPVSLKSLIHSPTKASVC